MKVTWLGHSCFKIESNNEVLVIDPFEDGSVPGLANVKEDANLCLSTHSHYDHNALHNINIINKNTVFKYEIINTYHDKEKGRLRGENKIYKISDSKYTIAHLGDLGEMLDDSKIKELQNLDLLLIPIGGFFTIDYKEAIDIIKLLKPKRVIPMHYRSSEFGYPQIDTLDNFINNLDNVVFVDSNSIDLESAKENKTYVLKYQK